MATRSVPFRLITIGLIGILLAACGAAPSTVSNSAAPTGTGAAAATPSPTPVHVRYVVSLKVFPAGQSPYYTSTPDYLGFFKQEGLDVEFQTADGGNNGVKVLAIGQGDILLAGAQVVFTAVDQGAKIHAFHSFLSSPQDTPAVIGDSPIKSVADLKGKTIGVAAMGQSSTDTLNALLVDARIDPKKDVSIIPIGTGGAQTAVAVKDKKVDAMMLNDSQYANLESLGLTIRQLPAPLLARFSFAQVLAVRDEFAQQHPDAVARFGRALAKATLFSQTNPEAAIRVHWKAYPETKATGLDEATALAQDLRAYKARIQKTIPAKGALWGDATDDAITASRDILFQSGQIKQQLPVSAYFTRDYLKQANDFDAAQIIDMAKNYVVK